MSKLILRYENKLSDKKAIINQKKESKINKKIIPSSVNKNAKK